MKTGLLKYILTRACVGTPVGTNAHATLHHAREASLFMGWGRYPAEWANFFACVFHSGRIILEVCFVVGEKFLAAKFAKTAILRYLKWANWSDS